MAGESVPDPWVVIETTGVHDQCRDGVASVMLNNKSVIRYRITVLKQKETDEEKKYVLSHSQRVWIGCADDGYKYTVTKTEPMWATAQQQDAASDITLPQTIAGGKTLKVSFYSLNGEPAVGILDVIHQFPEKVPKGDSRITWTESLEWGPSPNRPDDSWQKVVSVTNHTKDSQEIIVRFFFFR